MSEKKELSTIEKLQEELKKGGDVLDTFNHQITENLYDALSAQNVMTDLDRLYEIIQKSVKESVSVWAGGNTEPIVSHDAKKAAKDQEAEEPDLDTHKNRNNPDLNLALSGSKNGDESKRFEEANTPSKEVEKEKTPKKTPKKAEEDK